MEDEEEEAASDSSSSETAAPVAETETAAPETEPETETVEEEKEEEEDSRLGVTNDNDHDNKEEEITMPRSPVIVTKEEADEDETTRGSEIASHTSSSAEGVDIKSDVAEEEKEEKEEVPPSPQIVPMEQHVDDEEEKGGEETSVSDTSHNIAVTAEEAEDKNDVVVEEEEEEILPSPQVMPKVQGEEEKEEEEIVAAVETLRERHSPVMASRISHSVSINVGLRDMGAEAPTPDVAHPPAEPPTIPVVKISSPPTSPTTAEAPFADPEEATTTTTVRNDATTVTEEAAVGLQPKSAAGGDNDGPWSDAVMVESSDLLGGSDSGSTSRDSSTSSPPGLSGGSSNGSSTRDGSPSGSSKNFGDKFGLRHIRTRARSSSLGAQDAQMLRINPIRNIKDYLRRGRSMRDSGGADNNNNNVEDASLSQATTTTTEGTASTTTSSKKDTDDDDDEKKSQASESSLRTSSRNSRSGHHHHSKQLSVDDQFSSSSSSSSTKNPSPPSTLRRAGTVGKSIKRGLSLRHVKTEEPPVSHASTADAAAPTLSSGAQLSPRASLASSSTSSASSSLSPRSSFSSTSSSSSSFGRRKTVQPSFDIIIPEKSSDAGKVTPLSVALNDAAAQGMDPVEAKNKRRLQGRAYIVNEILATERSFVENLQMIIDLFVAPLRNAIQQGHPIIAPVDIRLIFSSIESLLKVNQTVLEELQEVAETFSHEGSCVGSIFRKHFENNQVYVGFVEGYATAKEAVRRCEKNSPAFQTFMADCLSNPACHRQGISDHLILPIQRVTRYVMLLSDLIKHTLPDHVDYEDLNEALTAMRKLAKEVNEAKRNEEQLTKMFELQKEIVDCPPTLISSSRRFVEEHRATHLEKASLDAEGDVKLYIFSDLLMFAKLTTNQWKTIRRSVVGLPPKQKPKFWRQYALKSIEVHDVSKEHDNRPILRFDCKEYSQKEVIFLQVLDAETLQAVLTSINSSQNALLQPRAPSSSSSLSSRKNRLSSG